MHALGRRLSEGCRCALQQQLRSLSVLTGSFSQLPIIDVAQLTNPDASLAQRQAVGRELHDACLKVGFFYAKGHGLPEELTEGVFAAARRWFARPEEEKQRIALSPASHYRGWQRLGSNVTQGRRDWHEGIDLYKEVDVAALQAGGLPHSPIHGCNPWPQDPHFERLLRRYVDSCLSLGAAVLRGIALGLQLPEGYFGGDLAGDSYWVTRVIYYPPLQPAAATAGGALQPQTCQGIAGADASSSSSSSSSSGGGGGMGAGSSGSSRDSGSGGDAAELSCGEHTDYGLLTLVFQEQGVTALQVKNREGRWVDAPPVPGTCVVNIGDMFRVLTNGLYTPTPHRVLNASGRDRVSIPFFYETNFEARIAPHPQFCRDRPPLFEPVRYGSHLESKVLNNFDFQGGKK